MYFPGKLGRESLKVLDYRCSVWIVYLYCFYFVDFFFSGWSGVEKKKGEGFSQIHFKKEKKSEEKFSIGSRESLLCWKYKAFFFFRDFKFHYHSNLTGFHFDLKNRNQMAAKVATTGLQWPILPYSPSYSQTLVSAISSPSSKHRSHGSEGGAALVCRHVRRL